jgi:hypothetical protein
MTRMACRFAAMAVMVLMASSCATVATVGGWFHGHKPEPAVAAAAPDTAPVQKTAKDHEDDLRALVVAEIEAAGKTADADRSQVAKRAPYYYRHYEVYPEGSIGLKIAMQERETRSIPYMADVTVAKQIYATRMYRKRKEAEKDANFLRDTGAETATYELRNSKWTRVGSMFVANKSEENVNGEWVPIDETVKRVAVAEEKKVKVGWFKRIWATITGQEIDETQAAKDAEREKPKGTPGGSQSSMPHRYGNQMR